jgi:hypothetical protein
VSRDDGTVEDEEEGSIDFHWPKQTNKQQIRACTVYYVNELLGEEGKGEKGKRGKRREEKRRG